jgi:hypothetical protein
MKKLLYLLIVFSFFTSCNSRYSLVSSNKITEERKLIARNFLESYYKKCEENDYSEFKNIKVSKRFERYLISDSIKSNCGRLERKEGKVTLGKFVSAHTANSPKDFMDVYNFTITSEKNPAGKYIHLGMYRDQNYLEIPFYISADENYYESMRKKYYKK